MRKIVAVSVFLMLVSIPVTASAADPVITLREDAPVYTGPVQDENLEELTVEDFEEFGTEVDMPAEQYRQYKKGLEQPVPGSLVLYKMKIVDRDLTLNDFLGFNVPEKLSEARYDGYLNMNPVTVDGRTIHYVYVYHSPLDRTESEAIAAEKDLSSSLSDE